MLVSGGCDPAYVGDMKEAASGHIPHILLYFRDQPREQNCSEDAPIPGSPWPDSEHFPSLF